MFLRNTITTSTVTYSDSINRLKNEICKANVILVGAGAGLSTSAGLTYSGERFDRYFADFREKYEMQDMYSGGFYPFNSLEEYWAWWSRHIWYNRYAVNVGKPYSDLLALVRGKNYFVLTTNVDHQFQKAGFDKERLFYTQGDYGLWQCVHGCKDKTFDNEEQVKKMIEQQKNMKIPSDLIPRCPFCGEPMTMNLRCDDSFVQDEGWHLAARRYEEFVHRHKGQHTLYIELGVGSNTPAIIKYPFWRMTAQNPYATYACINLGEAFCPNYINARSICINADIGQVLSTVFQKQAGICHDDDQ